MKKTFLFFLTLFGILVCCFFLLFSESSVQEKRHKHKVFLENSPVKASLLLSKAERKSQGLPPNKYFEREWELTMNPATGKPEPEKVLALQSKRPQNIQKRVPGGASQWIERGPNNVGGRTRTLLFDPNDPTHKRVFAGGVSGGLWVNQDITNPNTSWSAITNVPSNMSVSCIAVDPNDSNIFYLGTGELYTSGSVTGNGVYKSTDAGMSWTNIFEGNGGSTQTSGDQKVVPGAYFVQDIAAWNNNGTTEIFIAVGASYWRYGGAITTFLGDVTDYGVYKTTDGGAQWTKPSVPLLNGNLQQPNDFEISADNKIWLATTGNYFGDSGGAILKSSDGNQFFAIATLPNLNRTEIEVSATDPEKLYVLGSTNAGVPIIYKTTDAFASSPTEMPLPKDADTGISEDDFTRGQSFYDLVIEADPSNDEILYVGGIDLFRSANGGSSWTQISKWSFNNDLADLNVPLVHADQHAMVFRPDNPNQAVFGNDGGVYFANDLKIKGSNTSIVQGVKNYNVTQFYSAAIAPTAADEFFLGGTQDNGTPYFYNPNPLGPDQSNDISGGDGATCFVDQVGADYLIVSYVYNAEYSLYDFNKQGWRSIIRESDNSEGDFINQADLDSNMDILYTNASIGSSYRLYRFSDLTNIPEGGSASKTILESSLLNSFPTALKVSPYTTEMTKLLVGTETGNLFSVQAADSNPVWEEITGPSFVGSISDIEFGASESEILVTFHNYGVDNIWWSFDGGSTWTSKEGDLPDLPVKSILQNPIEPNEVIVGTELGVWKTENWEDSAPNWEHAYNGMSDVKVTDLQYRKEGQTVLAATYGRGLFTGIFEANPPPLSISEFVNDTTTTIPKGFSPNGDGSYDTWLLDHVAEMYPKHQIQIFNRSGVLVYDGKLSANSDWDGFSNVGSAEKLPVGTYYYRLNLGVPVATFNEKSYPKKGVIYIKY
jgi:gliding motility-associated-like protein